RECTEDRHEQLRAARAHQPGDTQHLAPMHAEAGVVHGQPSADVNIFCAQVSNLQRDFSWNTLACWKKLGDGPANHLGDHLLRAKFVGVMSTNIPTVAQHRDAAAQPKDLLETM